MKKFEFLDVVKAAQVKKKSIGSELEKKDESELPAFVKEIPVSFKRREEDEVITVDYNWPALQEDNIKIKKLILRKGEQLEGLYRIYLEKEVDSFTLQYKNAVYVFRKTTEDVAKAIFTATKNVKTGIENIAGYIKTVIGSFFLISKLIVNSWAFDKAISTDGIRLINKEKLTSAQKKRLFDLIVEKLVEINSVGLVLRDFTLNNVLLTNDSIVFTDLRKLRAVKKKPMLVEEFRRTLRYLISAGLGEKEHTYGAVAYYCAAHTKTCETWYNEKNGKDGDSYSIASAIEEGL